MYFTSCQAFSHLPIFKSKMFENGAPPPASLPCGVSDLDFVIPSCTFLLCYIFKSPLALYFVTSQVFRLCACIIYSATCCFCSVFTILRCSHVIHMVYPGHCCARRQERNPSQPFLLSVDRLSVCYQKQCCKKYSYTCLLIHMQEGFSRAHVQADSSVCTPIESVGESS